MIYVNYKQTIAAYLKYETAAEASKALGIQRQTFYKRIEKLKKAGVQIPKRDDQGIPKPKVVEFNTYIQKILSESKEY